MPRIVMIVDEFHNMTQAVSEEQRYKILLENILSEYRALGFTCVFSDQAISTGLHGLTEKARKQIHVRLAMKNDISEIKETLSLDNSLYDDEFNEKTLRMGMGDVIFKQIDDNNRIFVDIYKVIYANQEERQRVMEEAVKYAEEHTIYKKNRFIIDGMNRMDYSTEIIRKYSKEKNIDDERQIPIYLGSPTNLERCFCFHVRKKLGANMMVIGSDNNMRTSVIINTIRSFAMANADKIFIFADENDELFDMYKNDIYNISACIENAKVIHNYSEIGNIVADLVNLIEKRESRRILICWIGLENMIDEFSMYQVRNAISSQKSVSEQKKSENVPQIVYPEVPVELKRISDKDELIEKLNQMIDSGEIDEDTAVYFLTEEEFRRNNENTEAMPSADEMLEELEQEMLEMGISDEEIVHANKVVSTYLEETDDEIYDLRPEIKMLFEKGPRYGIHSLVTYSSARMLSKPRFIDTGDFENRIAFHMSASESSDYFGNSKYASQLDDLTGVYSDGSSIFSTFRPFKL